KGVRGSHYKTNRHPVRTWASSQQLSVIPALKYPNTRGTAKNCSLLFLCFADCAEMRVERPHFMAYHPARLLLDDDAVRPRPRNRHRRARTRRKFCSMGRFAFSEWVHVVILRW